MDKNSNIKTGHSYEEYRRYFGKRFDKGKLVSYSLKEKNLLDHTRQYWLLTNEHKEKRYYELPRYIKPDDERTALSVNRIMHRRPARAAFLILGLTVAVSLTSFFISKSIFSNRPLPPDEPIVLEDLEKFVYDYQEWAKQHPGEDATGHFKIDELVNVAIGNTLYNPDSFIDGHYSRRPFLAVGYGHTTTNAIIMVDVDISNAFITNGSDALEESISYSGQILAPKVGKRDFYTKDDNAVNAHNGDADSSTTIKWKEETCATFTKEDYMTQAGKDPTSPFLYDINKDTILLDDITYAKKVDSGYEIKINLDTTNGIKHYVQRMYYLSGKTATNFYKVNLLIQTDSNLRINSFSVDEAYDVETYLYTTGKLATRYYYNEVPPIPNPTDSFDYSKYPA